MGSEDKTSRLIRRMHEQALSESEIQREELRKREEEFTDKFTVKGTEIHVPAVKGRDGISPVRLEDLKRGR